MKWRDLPAGGDAFPLDFSAIFVSSSSPLSKARKGKHFFSLLICLVPHQHLWFIIDYSLLARFPHESILRIFSELDSACKHIFFGICTCYETSYLMTVIDRRKSVVFAFAKHCICCSLKPLSQKEYISMSLQDVGVVPIGASTSL